MAHDVGRVGVVVIGRNEGERLRRCLASLPDAVTCVYVDSNSTDQSVAAARAAGVDVIELAPPGLSAARARNSGLEYLAGRYPDMAFVQMVDGDCEVQPGWFDAALEAFRADPGLGLVFGRRRERFPEQSIYNALCDDEWNVPVGEALTCGGDVLCRVAPLRAAGGYDEAMIAGEDPDMSTRVRKSGWRIARIDAEMTLHDAAITRFGQWWRRAQRSGHAFAELAHRHPGLGAPDWRRQCRSIVAWGAVLPAVIVLALLGGLLVDRLLLAIAAIGLLAYPLQMVRLQRKRPDLPPRLATANGVLLALGKLPQAIGLLQYHRTRLRGGRAELIEYKGPTENG